MSEVLYFVKGVTLMEMLPGAVQVLITWCQLLVATLLTFFKRLNGDNGDTSESSNEQE